MLNYFLSLFELHSYLILFTGIFLELLAFPISGEFLMSYSGFFVYQGKMNYLLALLSAFCAGGAGITVTFWIGKAGGYRLIEKYGRYIHLGPEKFKKMASWFEKSGSKLLVFAYFIPGVRHFTGYVSGISRMPFRKFIIPAYTGSFLWGISFITLGKILGPRWQNFHNSASKYFVITMIILALLLGAFFIIRKYNNQIKDFFIRLLKRLMVKLRTIRAVEVFLIFLTLGLIGLISLMLGMAQDYLYNEFTQFNELTNYLIHSIIPKDRIRGLMYFQSYYLFGALMLITMIRIWRKGHNRMLEYLMMGVSLLGVRPFHQAILNTFSYLLSLGIGVKLHSADFPDENATIVMSIYGTCLFLLVRHAKSNLLQLLIPLMGLILLVSMGFADIVSSSVLPSNLIGGYVYGSVWIFFNFLLFEILRLAINKQE